MLSATTTMDATLSGVKNIADILNGRISAGSLMIIEGESGTGKSILSLNIAYGALNAKDSAVAYYTTDGTDIDLINKMDSFSLHALHEYATDRLRIYPLSSPHSFGDTEESLELLINYISRLPARFKLIVVDSITPFMNNVSPMSKIGFFVHCKALCTHGRAIILVADTHTFEKGTRTRTHQISDYYLRLRSDDMMLWTGQIHDRFIKTLEVLKLQGVELQGGECTKFEIKPGSDIEILPFFKVKI